MSMGGKKVRSATVSESPIDCSLKREIATGNEDMAALEMKKTMSEKRSRCRERES